MNIEINRFIDLFLDKSALARTHEYLLIMYTSGKELDNTFSSYTF